MTARRCAQIQIIVSAVLFSTGGLFVGLLHVDVFVILFWRSLFAAVIIVVWIWIQGWPWRRLDRAGLAAVFFSATATLAFVPALRLTAVANVALIHALLPLVSAVLLFLAYRERVSIPTLWFCLTAASGAIVIFAGSVSSTTGSLGNALAMLMTISMALMTLAFNRSRCGAIFEMVALSNIAVTIIVFIVSRGQLALPADQVLVLFFFALLQMALGLLFYAAGSTKLKAPEAALISILEVPLSAIWARIFLNQTPTTETLIGGGLIMAAVVVHLLASRGGQSVW